MGRKMIKSTASSILSRSLINGDGLNLDKLENFGVELLEDEASLDYLCNLSPHRYEALYAKVLPESMLGETFLEKYADDHDAVTVIDPKRTYGVRAPAKHSIYANFRVKIQRRYKKATGYLPLLFEGSSPVSGKFGYLKIHRIPNKPN